MKQSMASAKEAFTWMFYLVETFDYRLAPICSLAHSDRHSSNNVSLVSFFWCYLPAPGGQQLSGPPPPVWQRGQQPLSCSWVAGTSLHCSLDTWSKVLISFPLCHKLADSFRIPLWDSTTGQWSASCTLEDSQLWLRARKNLVISEPLAQQHRVPPSWAAPACATAGRQRAAKSGLSAWVPLMDHRTHLHPQPPPRHCSGTRAAVKEFRAGRRSGKASTHWQLTAGANAQSIHPSSASLPGGDILPKTATLSSAIIG